MKAINVIVSIIAVVVVQNAQAENSEVIQAQELLSTHASNCNDGQSGWWLKLETTKRNSYRQGGISTSNGLYWGCGTCDECRTKLNQDVDVILGVAKEYCKQRGGEIKSEDRGLWKEDIFSSSWTISVIDVDIVCEKWISCHQ